jgi:glutathione S-transferase
MLTLYGNAFSPFSRKVQLVLEHKAIDYEMVDGLSHANHDRLAAVNKRLEVPAIDHDGLVVVNSADIVAYFERVFPDRPVYPSDHESWVKARAWERCADSVIDPILVDISYWVWAIREDQMPDGLLDAARTDLGTIYDVLDKELEERDWVSGELSIADIALFPHLSGTRVALSAPARMVQALPRTEDLRGRCGAHESIPRGTGSHGHRAREDLLARRSNRMVPRSRLPRMVCQRDRRGPRPVASARYPGAGLTAQTRWRTAGLGSSSKPCS